MSSQQQTAYEFANLQGFLNLLVSIIEGAAWAMFGTSIIWQMGFCAWAIAMVFVRQLFEAQEKMLRNPQYPETENATVVDDVNF